MIWAVAFDFVTKNWKPLLLAALIVGIISGIYWTGRSSMKDKVTILQAELESSQLSLANCVTVSRGCEESVEKLKLAINEQNSLIEKMAEEHDEEVRRIESEHRQALITRERNWSEALLEIRKSNNELRERMAEMSACEACNEAMKEIAR